MGFVDNLRMNSLFGGGDGAGNGGLDAPHINPAPDLISEYATRMLPIIHGEQDRQQAINQRLSNQIRAQQQYDAQMARQNPNVVFNPNGASGISPLQRANLGLKEEAEQGKNDRATASLNEKQQSGVQTDKIRQQRADVYQFKATHPNLQLKEQRGGNIIAIDPLTGKGFDTGFATGTLSDEDKMNLNLTNEMKEIGARGDQSRQTDSQRANENLGAIAAKAAQTRQTNAAKPQNTKPQSSSDLKTQYFNKAQQMMNDPAYSQYIKMGDRAGEFTIDPNTPQDTYHMINQGIYGNPNAKDIELPADNNSDTQQSQQPAKDSLGIR